MVNFIAKYPPTKKRYCARCNTLVEYTEVKREQDDGWNQYCIKCGCIVGMRYPIKENQPWVIDPYQWRDSYARHHR